MLLNNNGQIDDYELIVMEYVMILTRKNRK